MLSAIKRFVRDRRLLHNASRVITGYYDIRVVLSPKGYQLISLDYPVTPTPRYGYGKPPHKKLYEILDENRGAYIQTLEGFLDYRDALADIPVSQAGPQEPYWDNDWVDGLDAVALYSFLCQNNPAMYLEIGSGNSTKFARRAISQHNLRTKITSVDPNPRADIDEICDRVIRQALESLDLALFEELGQGDILFVDGSHRSFMNSDASVMFLEVMPMVKPGVLVHIHDILIPYDYPPGWKDRYYSEQYLLAVHTLSGSDNFEVLLPNAFVSEDPELRHILDPLWNDPRIEGIRREGTSFWMRRKT